MHLVERTNAACSKFHFRGSRKPRSYDSPGKSIKGFIPLNNHQWKPSNLLLIKKVVSCYLQEGFATGRSLAM